MVMSGEQLAEMMRHVNQTQIEFWRQETLFTWRWWVLVLLFFAPWFVWCKVADKKRLLPLVLFLLFIMVLTMTVDEIFTCLPLRFYSHNLNPLLYRSISLDYAFIPILFTLIYQWFVTWNNFFWAVTVLALFISFIGEPLFMWLGFYVLIQWNYFYGVPVYLAAGLLSKWFVDALLAKTQKARETRL